ncbi:MAG TPA: hypothetical protein VFC36_04145 [Paludibacter sp.]|nr:hypothetical protein [Paludibacter sp.]
MKDEFTKRWIIDNSVEICERYEYGVLTLRSLHYQLVGIGMTNDVQHYKRVVTAMIDARWDGVISFDQFSDLDRSMVGETEHEETNLDEMVEKGKYQVEAWMTAYRKNRWENQPIYPEVLIEKKALQGVFAPICSKHNVSVGACKGYPSLTFLNEMANRYLSIDKKIVLLYFGDYDPSGEDIPRSIVENLKRFGVDVELKRMALMEDQVVKWNLPPAPAKVTDSRTAKWDGLGQVELDAVRPEKLQKLCSDAILELFDEDLYSELQEQESTEREEYQSILREFVNDMKID